MTFVEPNTSYYHSLNMDLLLGAVSSLKINLDCGSALPESYQALLNEQIQSTKTNLESPAHKNLWTLRKKIIHELLDSPEFQDPSSKQLEEWPMPERAQMDFERVFRRNTELLTRIKCLIRRRSKGRGLVISISPAAIHRQLNCGWQTLGV